MEGLPLHLCHSQHFSLPPINLLRFLFLFFSIFKPCLASLRENFGAKSSGCGDPAFRLDCDHKVNMPLLNISGYQYYILKPFGHQEEFPINSMRIVDRILLPVKNLDRDNRPLLEKIKDGFRVIWNFTEGRKHCEPQKENYNAGGSNTANKTAIVLGSSIGAVALIAAIAVLYILYVKRRKRPHIRGFGGDHSNYQRSDMEAGLVMNMMGNLPMFHYEELQQATNFFDEKNQLGDGGFGVVYLGKLKDGRAVAVKRLYEDRSRTVEQFMNEVQILSSLCHPNLVRLYGCTTPQSPMLLLVYEFVPNGTLSDHLHGCRRTPGGLPWVTRLDIAIETAQALAYLHNICPPILHRDVKSDNILLDEHFRAKVADFGLSSFGVVLVEIISAKVAVDIMRNRNEISLANMATDKIKRGVLDELVDPELKIERNQEVKVTVAAVAELTFECLAIERDFRPTMKEVVARLTEIKEMLQESSESSNSVSSTPTSSLTSLQENWPGVASD
ncbi:hypothetical protein SUGI_0116390 [Cryptomeria japonica]|nr:hypothetical protein SUGI_0116390 [Cryptomeria japonica]